MPRALQVAIEEDVEFRKGLPRDYLNIMGIANSDVVSSNLIKYSCKTRLSSQTSNLMYIYVGLFLLIFQLWFLS
jgi:hypothetical protein